MISFLLVVSWLVLGYIGARFVAKDWRVTFGRSDDEPYWFYWFVTIAGAIGLIIGMIIYTSGKPRDPKKRIRFFG